MNGKPHQFFTSMVAYYFLYHGPLFRCHPIRLVRKLIQNRFGFPFGCVIPFSSAKSCQTHSHTLIHTYKRWRKSMRVVDRQKSSFQIIYVNTQSEDSTKLAGLKLEDLLF